MLSYPRYLCLSVLLSRTFPSLFLHSLSRIFNPGPVLDFPFLCVLLPTPSFVLLWCHLASFFCVSTYRSPFECYFFFCTWSVTNILYILLHKSDCSSHQTHFLLLFGKSLIYYFVYSCSCSLGRPNSWHRLYHCPLSFHGLVQVSPFLNLYPWVSMS